MGKSEKKLKSFFVFYLFVSEKICNFVPK